MSSAIPVAALCYEFCSASAAMRIWQLWHPATPNPNPNYVHTAPSKNASPRPSGTLLQGLNAPADYKRFLLLRRWEAGNSRRTADIYTLHCCLKRSIKPLTEVLKSSFSLLIIIQTSSSSLLLNLSCNFSILLSCRIYYTSLALPWSNVLKLLIWYKVM